MKAENLREESLFLGHEVRLGHINHVSLLVTIPRSELLLALGNDGPRLSVADMDVICQQTHKTLQIMSIIVLQPATV